MRNGEAKLTHDDLNRRRVPPKDDRSRPVRFYDRYVWPGVHGKWWTFDVRAERIQTAEEICSRLRLDDVDQAKDTLDHVKVIAQDAADRAGAADRRANTIAGTVAIAASFTLSGGALALDPNK
jgi:hypothetical protein